MQFVLLGIFLIAIVTFLYLAAITHILIKEMKIANKELRRIESLEDLEKLKESK
jgi:large-conductance mechanosensitive channel